MTGLVAALALAAATSSGTLVVLNKAEATASLIDLASGSVVATVPTGQAPHEADVSPDGRYALATNYGTAEAPGSTLTVIDVPNARVVKTLSLGQYRRPHGVRWLADGIQALVTAEANKALLFVNVRDGALGQFISTGQDGSHMVAVRPDSMRAFVASIESGTVTAAEIGPKLRGVVVATGKGAEGIDVTPDGREVWVTNREADTVSIVDARSLEVLATLPAASFPIRVKVTPDGKSALVSCARSGEVAVFDVPGRKEVRRVAMKLPVGDKQGRMFQQWGDSPAPIGIVIRPDGKQAYVANANADAIAIVDLESWTIAGTLKAGKEPDGMAFSALAVQR
jgi:YVTN family beta-propeller protein